MSVVFNSKISNSGNQNHFLNSEISVGLSRYLDR